tara:strand:- start:142 stop:1734 length:1593 start_codon:yes stop_codon:yes gene_type:complete
VICAKFSRTITVRAVKMFSPKKITQYFITVLILLAILLSTCSEKSEYGDASDYEKLGAICVNSTGDTTAPTISELSPSDNSTNVPVASKVVVTFSDEMLAYSITTNTADTKCSGSFQLSSDNFSTCIKMSASPVSSDNDTTFTITPASSLSNETNYKFKITTSVAENSCNKLATDNTTTNGFTTASTGAGTIKGKVISDVNNSGLSGVNVQFYGTTIDNTTTDSNGEFNTEVDVGDYTISYSKAGFLDDYQDVPLETDGQTLEVATMRMLSSNCASTGTISGKLTDAVTSDNVSGVTMYLRRGYNSSIWRRLKASDTTDSSGGYSFNSMKRGWYTVRTYKYGYMNGKFFVRSCGDVGNQDFAIAKNLASTETMQIVLSWQPTSPVTGDDLDAHIQVPDNSTGSLHLHWAINQGGNENSGYDYWYYSAGDNVTLDRDEQDPPGTETITIMKVRSGFTYSYSVHDYENNDNTSSTNMGNSGAFVTVYYNNTRTVYPVPSGVGNLWRVFTFTVSGGQTIVNTMTNIVSFDLIY